MILINEKNFKFAFNWKPKVKPKKIVDYHRGDDFALLDIWKFRTLVTGLKVNGT